jgi:hypothetical protein
LEELIARALRVLRDLASEEYEVLRRRWGREPMDEVDE